MKSFDFYWKLTRPHTLPASAIPAIAGVCFAIYAEQVFHPLLALLMVLSALLIQIATNFFNEYFDYKNGLDTEESVGIGGAIVREGISPRAILIAAFVLYGISGIPRFILIGRDGKIIDPNAPRPSSDGIISYLEEHMK